MKLRLLLAPALFLSTCLVAHADSFNFAFTGTGISATGSLMTAGNANGAFSLVTSFTGTQNGSAITLLSVGAFAGNDNLFEDLSPFYDFKGLSYSVSGVDYNIYSNKAGQMYLCTTCSGGQTDGMQVTFSATPTAAVTPEPSSLILLGTGVVGIVGVVRRRLLA